MSDSSPRRAFLAVRILLGSAAMVLVSALTCPATARADGWWHPPLALPKYDKLPSDDSHLDELPDPYPNLPIRCGIVNPPDNGGAGPGVMTQVGFGFVDNPSPFMNVYGFAAAAPSGSNFIDICDMNYSENAHSSPVPINMIEAAGIARQIVTRAQWNAGFSFPGSTGWTKPDTTGSAASFDAVFGVGYEAALVYWPENSSGVPTRLNNGFDLKMMAMASAALYPESGFHMSLAAFGDGTFVTGSTTFVPEPASAGAVLLFVGLFSRRRAENHDGCHRIRRKSA